MYIFYDVVVLFLDIDYFIGDVYKNVYSIIVFNCKMLIILIVMYWVFMKY